MIKYVLCIAVNKAPTKIVLIEKLKPAFQFGKLNAPGGKVDQGDYDKFKDYANLSEDELTSAVARYAAHREFFEETGVYIPSHEWKHVITLHSGDLNRYGDKDNWEMYICYVAQDAVLEAKTMEKEKVFVLPFSHVHVLSESAMMPNLRWIVPLCADGKFLEVIHVRER